MLQEGLYSLLAGSSAITAQLGTTGTRADGTTGIFPVQMPEATPLPAIVITQIAGAGDVTLDGDSGFRNSRIQFSCYARTYADSKRLAHAVWALLEGIHATLADGTQIDVAVVSIESDSFAEEPFVYHTPLEIEFYYREAA